MTIEAERGDPTPAPTQAPVFVNDEEGAALLRISKSHFRRLVASGELPSPRRLGRRRIWGVEELLGAVR